MFEEVLEGPFVTHGPNTVARTVVHEIQVNVVKSQRSPQCSSLPGCNCNDDFHRTKESQD